MQKEYTSNSDLLFQLLNKRIQRPVPTGRVVVCGFHKVKKGTQSFAVRLQNPMLCQKLGVQPGDVAVCLVTHKIKCGDWVTANRNGVIGIYQFETRVSDKALLSHPDPGVEAGWVEFNQITGVVKQLESMVTVNSFEIERVYDLALEALGWIGLIEDSNDSENLQYPEDFQILKSKLTQLHQHLAQTAAVAGFDFSGATANTDQSLTACA